MPTTPRILAFAGSTRVNSYDKKLVRVAAAGARAAGAEVTFVDLRDLPLPLFDEDLEASGGMPENARKLKQLFLSHHGLLIAAAEYNSGPTAVLKNAIDWVSRKGPGELQKWPFDDRYAALLCASPGALGGLRVLPMLRTILSNIDIHVLPDQVAVPFAHEAFDAEGNLKDPKRQAAVSGLGAKLAQVLAKVLA